MAYVIPVHRPSSVRHAIKLRLLDADEDCLVVAKANRLEIYRMAADGLVPQHSKAVYGKITMLQKLRPPFSSTDQLFIGTDRYMYFTLSWDLQTSNFITESSYVDQADKTARDSQTGDRCHIDPSKRFMTLEIYEGVITVLPIMQKTRKKLDLAAGSLGTPVLARIPELFVRSSAFLHPRSNDDQTKPRLALLYEDNHQKVKLVVRTLDYAAGGSSDLGSVYFDDIQCLYEDLELGANLLIPVPAPMGGVLVLAETSITYIDDTSGDIYAQPLDEATVFVTWQQVDHKRFLIADEYGHLLFLMLNYETDDKVIDWKLDVIGKASRASVVVHLSEGYAFVGSHQGDSQVVKINESLEVAQTISNIAPILDFAIMDMGSRGEGQTNEFSSGQARIVTGSGAFQDGSLRSVRSGVGLEELGILGEMNHISNLFGLSTGNTGSLHDLLAISYIDETRLLQFSSGGGIEEISEFKGLILSEGTLLASNLPGDRILQVTRTAVRIVDLEDGITVTTWMPPTKRTIIAASASSKCIALSIGGDEVVILDLLAPELYVLVSKSFGSQKQVSCLTVPSSLPGICIVGFWQNTSVSFLSIDTLEELTTTVIGSEITSIPRSVLLTQILSEQPPTLFVALADGHVITFSVNTQSFALSEKKSIVLGKQEPSLKALPRGGGLYNVFVTCEHPSLIYGSENRLVYSAVTAEKATCVCSFDAVAYQNAIAIASPEDVKIAMVDTERTTHVQTLPVGETVRRIAYSSELKAFGLGTIKRTLRAGAEIVQSHFKLVDEILFEELDTFELKEDELVESVIQADIFQGVGRIHERFVVGTAYLDNDHDDAIRGRIIVFEVIHDRKLKVVTELAVKGACRALGVVAGNIVAALVKTVVVYAFENESLNKMASYRTSTAPIDITVSDNLIIIGDLMKSMSIVEYRQGSKGEPDTLVEVARHFQTTWSTAVAHVAQETFLEADAEGNLMVLHQNTNGVTADDRRRLEVTSEIRLGESVNRIRRIDVPSTADSPVIPRAFMGTVEGSIYLFALIHPKKRDLLMRLQANIANYVQSPGRVPFNTYRAFKNQVREADEPFRFVDGELVEEFLGCSAEMQGKIVKGLGVDVPDVVEMVETLRRLH